MNSSDTMADTVIIQPVRFTSTCPRCRRSQTQRGLSRVALQRFLDRHYPIEAYCVVCADFWTITAAERMAIAEHLKQ